MTALFTRTLAALSIAALTAGGALVSPAQATESGILGAFVTGRYLAGHSVDLAGAQIVAENLGTNQVVTLQAYGDPSTSAFYQATGVPFGRYRVRIARSGFATQYWPRQYAPESAGIITLGSNPGCDPAGTDVCDTRLLTLEMLQPATLSGTVRTRAGTGVASATVTATRTSETTYHPSTTTGPDGHFSVQIPPGDYRLSTPNGNSTAEALVGFTKPAVQDITVLDVPGPPRQVSAVGGNRSAAVSWQHPADNGGAPITSYTVTATPGSATCTTEALTCTLPGLDNGKTYQFTVTAENRIGRGMASASARTTASASVPAPVDNVRVTAADRAIDVTWAASTSDDVSEYMATASPGSRSCSTTSLACTISGLHNGKAYTVSVIARSQAGSSPASAPSRSVKPGATPSAPRNVTLSPKPSALRVTWKEPLDDGGHRISEYVATAWPGGKTCRTQAALKCVIRRLDSKTDYSVTVRAANISGFGATSPGSVPARPKAGPLAPGRVTGLRVRVHKHRATVVWRPTKRATSYLVRLKAKGKNATAWSVVRRPRAIFSVTAGAQSVQVRAASRSGMGKIRSLALPRY